MSGQTRANIGEGRYEEAVGPLGPRVVAAMSRRMSPRRARQLDNTVLYLITYVPLLFLVVVVWAVTG